MRENNSLLVILLVVVSGVLYPQLTAQPPAGSAPAITAKSEKHVESSPPSEKPSCDRKATQLVAELLGASTPETSACAAASDVEFLIATVPDPVDSRLGWLFDQYVDALQRAIEAKGYLIDRYALPWECARQAGSDADLKQFARLHERQPGVMVFRKDTKPLVVFLVGETPTSGIQKTAFATAVGEIEKCKKIVRVIGPSFSGSVHSLRVATDVVAKRGSSLEFSIVSGSATAPNELLDAVQPGRRFRGTVAPVEAQSRVLYTYLKEHGAHSEEIALLSEANSAYGQSSQHRRSSTQMAPPTASPPASATPTFGPRLTVPFPMHISQVRNAYEKDRNAKSQSNPPPGDVARRTLDLSLDDIGNPRDTLPAMAPALTANYDDLVLANILSTISREGIHYVGLLASDPRDKLFLAQQIRQYCPDVQLYTFGSDLLYAHPKYNEYLDGMIVVSTYPLFNQNQAWTGRDTGQRLQFSTNGVEGTYNATILQLSDAEGGPPAPGELIEYAPPFVEKTQEQKPPVWLTVVGHNGAWPLKFVTDYKDHDYVATALSSTYTPPARLSGLSLSVLFLISVFCVVNCVAFLRAAVWGRSRDDNVEGSPFDWFRPTRDPHYWPQQGLYIAVYFLLLMGGYAYVAAIYSGQLRGNWLAWALVVGCSPLLASVTLKIVSGAYGNFWQTRWTAAAKQWPLAWLWAGLAAVVFAALIARSSLRPVPAALLYERATNLASGVSPVVPVGFIAAALLLWSGSHLRRLYLLDRIAVTLPFADCKRFGSAGIAALEARIHAVVERATFGGQPAWIGTLLVVWGMMSWVLFRRFLPTLEGTGFDMVLIAMVLFTLLAIMVAFLRFVTLWFHLRRLLRRLTMHPMADAYRRLPMRVSSAVGNQLWSPLPTLADLELLVQHWVLLANHFPGVESQMPALLKLSAADEMRQRLATAIGDALKVAEGFATEFADAARAGGHGAVAHSDTRKQLTAVARLLVEVLEHFWRSRAPHPSDAGNDAPKPERIAPNTSTMEIYLGATTKPVDQWLRLAEDFVAVHVVTFLSYVFAHLRNLLTFVTLAILLLLFALTSYPFQPHQLLMMVIGGVMVSIVVVSVIVFVQIERNEVLSRIANTDPNRVNFHSPFVKGVLTFGVLPILTLIATQFPQLGRLLAMIGQAVK